MCYKAKICNILFPLRCAIAWYYFLPKSKFSDSSQKPWSIIRRFGRNSADSLWSFNSKLEGATKLIFAPFCSERSLLSVAYWGGLVFRCREREDWNPDLGWEQVNVQGRLSRDLRSYCMAQEIQQPLPALKCKQPQCYLHRVFYCYY